jgi:hypothetical protein
MIAVNKANQDSSSMITEQEHSESTNKLNQYYKIEFSLKVIKYYHWNDKE